MMKRLLILFFLILSPVSAFGASYCLLESAGGSADGSDWTNAFTVAATAEAAMSEGDTLYIGDGAYAAVSWKFATRSGLNTYIRKATADSHGTATGWDSGFGDGQATFTSTGNVWWIDSPNVTFNGASSTNDTLGYGFKLVSTTTTAAYNTIQISGWTGKTGAEVADSLAFYYVEVQGSGITEDYSTKLIYTEPASDEGVSRNINISHCYFHDSFQNHVLFRRSREVVVEYCVFNRHSSGTNHGESVSDAGSDSVTIRYNKFIDCGMGTGVIVPENNGDDSSDYWWVYGNLFYKSHGNPFNLSNPGNGIFATGDGNCLITYCYFFNNTIVNYLGGTGKAGMHAINENGNNLFCYNNLWFNCKPAALERPTGTYGWSGYNWFVNCSGLSPTLLSTELSQSDTSSVFTDHLNYDFSLSAASAVICTTLASPFNADPTGATRGDDGHWDAGYLEIDEDPSPPETTKTYYVQAGASGTGSYADPFGTIAEAEAAADSNDVVVMDGTLPEKITAPAHGVTYRGWHNASPPRIGGRVSVSGFAAAATTVTDSITTPLQDGGYNVLTRAMATANTQEVWGYTNSGQIGNGWLCFLVPALTNFSSWNSFKVRLFSLSNTGVVDFRIKTSKGYLKYTTQDTLKYHALQLESASRDSIQWNDTDPAVNTWCFTPELASILPSLAQNDTLSVLFNNMSSTNDHRINVEMTENDNSNQARIYYTYNTTGGGVPFYLVPAANRGFTRVWKSGVALTQAATHAALEAGKFYRSATGDSLFLVAADTTNIEIDGLDYTVDGNGKKDVLIRNIVINASGTQYFAVKFDSAGCMLYNCAIDSASSGIKILADSCEVYNNVISVSDTAMWIEPGKVGVRHDYNAYTNKHPGESTLPSKFIRREPFDRVRRAA